MAHCTDLECHDKAMEGYNVSAECHDALFDREDNVMTQLGNIRFKLGKCLTGKSVYTFILAILLVLVMSFITINKMWAETRDAPERRAKITQLSDRVIRLEEHQKSQDKLNTNIQLLLKRLDEIYPPIDKSKKGE